jgi:putative endonuclease
MPMERTRKGRQAEDLAAGFLRERGYRVLERNYRIREGELDLIAEDGDTLCFVEVRSRQTVDHGHPIETVDYAKQRRLIRAARHYVAMRAQTERWMRFDVVTITFDPLSIELYQDAFQSNDVW